MSKRDTLNLIWKVPAGIIAAIVVILIAIVLVIWDTITGREVIQPPPNT